MIDPSKVAFYYPKRDLKKFKQELFERVASYVVRQGGSIVLDDHEALRTLAEDSIPVVGCHPNLRSIVTGWLSTGRRFVYWDRGYAVRIFATWLRRPETGSGYYRWEVQGFQMSRVLHVTDDRWKALRIDVKPWSRGGRHIVIAAPTQPYSAFHGTERWTDQTVEALSKVTDRPLLIRSKETKRPLWEDCRGAHALVTHGSNAGNEAIIFGCPVFCHPSCAAALVGKTNINEIERPLYPDRQPWLNSLAYSQFTEEEMVSGSLWRMIR